jgi:two-component sensor histidine kinase
MALSRLKTSRARLLAILLVIMVPIVTLMAIAAWTNYRFTAASIERDYVLLTSNYASRLRVWLRGTERSVATAATSIGAIAGNDEECTAAARNMIDSVAGYSGFLLRFDNGTRCEVFSPGLNLDGPARAALLERAATGIAYHATGEKIGETHLYFSPDAGRFIAIHMRLAAREARPAAVALLLIDPAIMAATMALGDSYPGATIAAMLPNGQIVASHGKEAKGDRWRPADVLGDSPRRWVATGLDGVRRTYASQPVIDSGLYILGGFSDGELNRARNQFLILLLLPMLVIAALIIAFLRAIDMYVIDWLKRLEHVAHLRSNMQEATVEVSDKMPAEIRSFARAFNGMAAAEASRRAALETALDENRFLIRELHHRVKNSLQVIQSYLALERRDKTGEPRAVLLDAELRVQTLSLAYRSALAAGTIESVSLSEFLPQLLHLIANHVLTRGQIAMLEPHHTASSLELEKTIALAFLLANVIAGVAREHPQILITLRLEEANGDTTLTVDADRPVTPLPEPRINRGLMLQLGASALPKDSPTRLAGWCWPTQAAPTTARFAP